MPLHAPDVVLVVVYGMFVVLGALVLTPFVNRGRAFSWKRLFWTYIVSAAGGTVQTC